MHASIHQPYLSANRFDGEAEQAGHLSVVGEFEAGLGGAPHQDLVEDELVLIQDVNALSIAKLLGGEQAAVATQIVLLKDGIKVQPHP